MQPESSTPPDAARRFRRAQWRMLLATMFCYLFYYTGRQNWGWVVKSLRDDLGLDTITTGTIAGSMLAAYGVGQFVNGNLGDKCGGR
ncbi:MAG: MFS transporter, partial [Patescibacteria group bacterium]|nr:MFS transporter [Patescibacteria group bacterium]